MISIEMICVSKYGTSVFEEGRLWWCVGDL